MRNDYSLSEILDNIYSLAMTKLTMSQARLIRRPVYMRGATSLCGCKGLTTGRFCRFDLPGKEKTLYIGNNCEMGDMTHIVAYEKVVIGDNVLIASKCFISDTSHGSYKNGSPSLPSESPKNRFLSTSPVIIGSNVWIGENVVILQGTKIGSGSVIGANSVVTKDVDSNSIVAGIPAKKIKNFNDKTMIWEICDRETR